MVLGKLQRSHYFLSFASRNKFPQEYISSFLPALSIIHTASAARKSPSNPHTVPKEAGLKELQEKWPHNKMAVLVGSARDGVLNPEG